MQPEDFDTLSDKIQKEFEFDENSQDFVAFFKPFVIKVLSNIIFSCKIPENTKIKILNIISKSGKILSYFLESLNEKELLALLNDIKLSDLLIKNLTQENKKILFNKLNKEVGIFPTISLFDQIPNKIKTIIKELNAEQNQNEKNNNFSIRHTLTDDSFRATEKTKPIQSNETIKDNQELKKTEYIKSSIVNTAKNEQNNIQNLLGNINFAREVAELIKQTTIQKDQFLIIANKENISLSQLQKMESILNNEHDKRALLTNALLNPFVRNNIEIIKYIIQQAHDSSNFELWSNAMDILDILKEQSPEMQTDDEDSFVARLRRSRNY